MPGQIRPTLSRKNVKLCDLCGTLNLDLNKECWTCRWHGGFSLDEQTIAFAWQRLETRYEEVRIEHVTARRTFQIGDFGAARPASFPQRIAASASAFWQRLLGRHALRQAQRQARQHSQMPSPPDQLSI